MHLDLLTDKKKKSIRSGKGVRKGFLPPIR